MVPPVEEVLPDGDVPKSQVVIIVLDDPVT